MAKMEQWSPLRNSNDDLHCCWNGWAKDMTGTLIKEFIDDFPAWMSSQQALTILYGEFKTNCRLHGRPCYTKPFTLKGLGLEDPTGQATHMYPVLPDRIKAAHSRQIAMWAAERAKQIGMDPEATEHQRMRGGLAHWFLRYYFILNANKKNAFLTEEDATAAHEAGMQALIHYQLLANAALTSEVLLYRVRPKLHYWAHTVLEVKQTRENPLWS